VRRIADSGLLIAALDERDAYHSWARRLLEREPPPWLVCEAVLVEVSASIGSPEPVLEMLQVGDLEISFVIKEHLSPVLSLTRKYRDQGMDLADACVVRMSDLFDDSVVYTVDKTDFSVYRRHGRQAVRCVFPE
jgi:predicted nucleic acid-binding protein